MFHNDDDDNAAQSKTEIEAKTQTAVAAADDLIFKLEQRYRDVIPGEGFVSLEIDKEDNAIIFTTADINGEYSVNKFGLENPNTFFEVIEIVEQFVEQARKLVFIRENFNLPIERNSNITLGASSDLAYVSVAIAAADRDRVVMKFNIYDPNDMINLEDLLSLALDEEEESAVSEKIAELKQRFAAVFPFEEGFLPVMRASTTTANDISFEYEDFVETQDGIRYVEKRLKFNIYSFSDMSALTHILTRLHALAVNYVSPPVLVTDSAQIEKIIKALAQKPDGRYEKNNPLLIDLQLDYSIFKWGGKYYAIDRGSKYDNLVGEGTYGAVKRVQNINIPDEEGVLKIQKILFGENKAEALARINNEFAIIKLLHPQADSNCQIIVRQNKDGEEQMEFIMEKAQGVRLFEYIATDNYLTKARAEHLAVALAVMRAYQVVAKAGVIHCDISTKNIFYDKNTDTATIIDFGVAQILDQAKKYYESGRVVTCYAFAPPEFVDPNSPKNATEYLTNVKYNEATEIFSLGVVLADVLLPDMLTACIDRTNKQNAICSYHPIKSQDEYGAHVNNIINLINRMMHKNPAQRPSLMTVVAELKWLQRNLRVDEALAKDRANSSSYTGSSSLLFVAARKAITPIYTDENRLRTNKGAKS